MNKQVPYLFTGSISTPTEISENIGRAYVKVFTKYGNRNGSYITEQVAKQLVDSAINCPVVGFFDPQTGDWGSHVGPSLASAYGYVESFKGWEQTQDSDGVNRDYAVFSVILFSDYFEQANKIIGKSQSMELDVNSIDGEWTTIDGNEYFVYSKARMHGFCVLGDEIEPCFSSSVFFNKEESNTTQFDKFSKLLFELREEVKKIEGGETVMENENIITEEVSTAFEDVNTVDEVVSEEVNENFTIEEPAEEEAVIEEQGEIAEEFSEDNQEEETVEEETVVNYEIMYNELLETVDSLNQQIVTYQTTIDNLNTTLNEVNEKVANYEVQIAEVENAKKQQLIETYTNQIPEEDVSVINASINDFTYEELESKLAVAFAHYTMRTKEAEALRAPINQPEESDFAKLMKNYKRV